jgi:hypothetical protein
LGGARIFRLPSNAELGLPQRRYIYRTRRFPYWRLCLNSERHGGEKEDYYVLYYGPHCPICGDASVRHTETIRFVRACPDGHMDDIDWWDFIHNGEPCTHTSWFQWHGGGGSLAGIRLECPTCKAVSVSLGRAYATPLPCSGRSPETEPIGTQPYRPGCTKNARIIQRQASNLRIPEVLTLFSIPPRHTRLHELLQRKPILHNLAGSTPSSMDQLRVILSNLAQRNLISSDIADEVAGYPWDEVRGAIQDVLGPVKTHYPELLLDEFRALIDGSVRGVPPRRGPTPKSPVVFEVDPNLVVKATGPVGKAFRVTPVLRLKTVIVQRGYRREVDTQAHAKVVDVSFSGVDDPQQRWYPGAEFLGEGIFIMLHENDGWTSGLTGVETGKWVGAFSGSSMYPEEVFRDSHAHEELHPSFVWWHTLSHFLVRALSTEAGYSSASIRERVYLETGSKGARGGILLYAAQPGSEGTLGGLIALTPYLQDMLDVAFRNAERCSGDPLCRGNLFEMGRYNGSACYGCLLLSETSCEHRNMWLDRNVILENLP